MSRETLRWLNENVLVGYADKKRAWHSLPGFDNHYDGPVPPDEVRRRLFNWEAVEHPIHAETGLGEYLHIPNRKAIVRSDNGHCMGVFSDGYRMHQYDEWLLKKVETILDDDLQIGSAGLLRGGAVGWVSVEVPENIETPEGVVFRPSLMARHSFDGSVATTYGRHITNVVCDNTMDIASTEHGGQQVKIRSTAGSLERLPEVREALGIIYSAADDFSKEVAELCDTVVTDDRFDQVVMDLVPAPQPKTPGGRPDAGAMSRVNNKRLKLHDMWRTDPRVEPWRGSAFGAWQAFNTFRHHEGQIRKSTVRPERNMLRSLDGRNAQDDAYELGRILDLAGANFR